MPAKCAAPLLPCGMGKPGHRNPGAGHCLSRPERCPDRGPAGSARPGIAAPRTLEAALAALIHDVGMLAVPVEIYGREGPLNEEQQRVVESHTRIGAELVGRLLPTGSWLTEVTAMHHERLDGTGYPAGLRHANSPAGPLSRGLRYLCRLLHGPSASSRARAAHGRDRCSAPGGKRPLDQAAAERLLHLSFYPLGLVELADCGVGVVVATHPGHADLDSAGRSWHCWSTRRDNSCHAPLHRSGGIRDVPSSAPCRLPNDAVCWANAIRSWRVTASCHPSKEG